VDPVDELPRGTLPLLLFAVAIVVGGLAGFAAGGSFRVFFEVLLAGTFTAFAAGNVAATARLERALAREDAEGALRAVRLQAMFIGRLRGARDVLRTNLLAACTVAEDWERARRAIEAIDWSATTGRSGPMLRNNAAWCLAMMGDLARAIPLAEQALATAPSAGRGFSSSLGTLGVALTLAGRHDEAIRRIEEALRIGGSPRAQSIRAFYLGEAWAAKGDQTRARAAYERSMRERPEGRWATRAREQLAKMVPYR
jgi:tetratricopeptide (TPR) repeat protein